MVDIAGGLGAMSQAVQGINAGLSQYMSQDLQLKAHEMERAEKKADAQANIGTISAGKLVALNPKAFKSIWGDVDPNTPVGVDFANTVKGLAPDDSSGGGRGGGSQGISVDGLGDLAALSGADPDTVSEGMKTLKKHGVTTIPTGLAENTIKNLGGDVKTATAISILKDDPQFQALGDDDKVARIRSLKNSLNGKGLKDVPEKQLDGIVQATVQAYRAAVANPGQFPDPYKAVATELSKRYKDTVVNRVMIRMHDLNDKGGAPKPTSSKWKWLKDLYGNH